MRKNYFQHLSVHLSHVNKQDFLEVFQDSRIEKLLYIDNYPYLQSVGPSFANNILHNKHIDFAVRDRQRPKLLRRDVVENV